MLHVGFTGTRSPLQPGQVTALREVLAYYRRSGYLWLHHGDCIGGDAKAHELSTQLEMLTHGHPPDAAVYRAFCTFDKCERVLPYLARNRCIVEDTAVLVAAPLQPFEWERSGTWATVRYARKLQRPIILVLPDGVTHREGPHA